MFHGNQTQGEGHAKTIDEYLAALDADKRAALARLRKIIRAAAPGLEEGISYQLPAFRGTMGSMIRARDCNCAVMECDHNAFNANVGAASECLVASSK